MVLHTDKKNTEPSLVKPHAGTVLSACAGPRGSGRLPILQWFGTGDPESDRPTDRSNSNEAKRLLAKTSEGNPGLPGNTLDKNRPGYVEPCEVKDRPVSKQPSTRRASSSFAGLFGSGEDSVFTHSAVGRENTKPERPQPKADKIFSRCAKLLRNVKESKCARPGTKSTSSGCKKDLRGSAEPRVDLSIAGEEKQNPSHDKPSTGTETSIFTKC